MKLALSVCLGLIILAATVSAESEGRSKIFFVTGVVYFFLRSLLQARYKVLKKWDVANEDYHSFLININPHPFLL